MTTIHKIGKKINFSFFIFHFLLLLIFTSIASADFTRDDSTKIVIDNETGLQWQDNESVQKIWQDAINYCEALTLGTYDDWRLPNRNELDSIVDDTKYNPSMSPVFQSYASNYFWSSTTYVYSKNYALFVHFSYGYQGRSLKDDNYYVRCVRAGQ